MRLIINFEVTIMSKEHVSDDFIRRLILDGTRLDSISSLWGVPMDKLDEMKKTIQLEQDQKFRNTFDELRQRYYEIYNPKKNNYTEFFVIDENKEVAKKLGTIEKLRQDILVIDRRISDLKAQINISRNDTIKFNKIKKELSKEHNNITTALFDYLEELKKFEKESMSLTQLSEIVKGLAFSELQNSFVVNNSHLLHSLDQIKIRYVNAYAMKLTPIIHKISDIDLLRKLKKEVSILDRYYLSVEIAKMKINTRIDALSQFKRADELKKVGNKVGKVEKITTGIIDGSITCEEASKILQEHAYELVNSRTTTYKVSFYDEKERIKMQIKSEIAKSTRAIKNPIESVKQLATLFECGYTEALPAVVKNLCSHEKYHEARELIEYFRLRDNNISKMSNSYNGIEKEVICAEIGQCIKQVVTRPRCMQEDKARSVSESRFMQTIYRRIQNSGLRMGAISLGKSEDKSRDIFLRDVWPETIEQGLFR